MAHGSGDPAQGSGRQRRRNVSEEATDPAAVQRVKKSITQSDPAQRARLQRAATEQAHKHKIADKKLDIVSCFEAVGKHAGGDVDDKELALIEETAIPGAGSCGGMYTANTMASAIEALGMSLPNSSAQNAVSREKDMDARAAGLQCYELIKRGIRPLDILTKEAFENAITVVIALGGSTNAVLHLIAMAHAAGVKIGLDDFTRIGKKVPVLADLKPSGRFLMSELVAIGGQLPLMKMLLEEK